MPITREQAIAELERRKSARGQQMQNGITREQARAELERRKSLQESKKGWRGIGEDVLSGFSNVPEALYDLVAQAPGEIYGAGKQIFTDPARAAQNLGQGAVNFGEGLNNLYPNARDYLREKGITQQTSPDILHKLPHIDIGEETGRGNAQAGDALLSSLVEYGMPIKLGKIGSPAISKLGKIAKSTQMPASISAHAIGQNENPITEALTLGIAGKAGKTLGKGASAVYKYGEKVNRSFPVEKPTSKILADRAVNEKIDNKNYQNFKQQVKGISIEKMPEINLPGIEEGIGKTQIRNIKRFKEGNTSIEQAIKADKELSKILRDINKKSDKGPKDTDAYYYAEKARDSLRKSIRKTLKNSGKENIEHEYDRITKFHAERVEPYRHPLIEEHLQKKSTPEDFAKALSRNKAWRAGLGKEYPEIDTNRSLTGQGTSAAQHVLAHMVGGAPANMMLFLHDILKGRR